MEHGISVWYILQFFRVVLQVLRQSYGSSIYGVFCEFIVWTFFLYFTFSSYIQYRVIFDHDTSKFYSIRQDCTMVRIKTLSRWDISTFLYKPIDLQSRDNLMQSPLIPEQNLYSSTYTTFNMHIHIVLYWSHDWKFANPHGIRDTNDMTYKGCAPSMY